MATSSLNRPTAAPSNYPTRATFISGRSLCKAQQIPSMRSVYLAHPVVLSTDNPTRTVASKSTSPSPKTTLSSRQPSASRPRSTTQMYQTMSAAPCAWACCVQTSGSRQTKSRTCLRWLGQLSKLLSLMMPSRRVLRMSSRTTGQLSTRRLGNGWRSMPKPRKRRLLQGRSWANYTIRMACDGTFAKGDNEMGKLARIHG